MPSIVDSPSTLRPMLRLALPVMAANLLHVLVEYVDTWLAGNFLREDSYLAAISLVRYLMWMTFTLFSFVAIGAMAMVARFIGAGDRRTAIRVTNQAISLGVLFSLLFSLVGWLAADEIVAAMQLEGDAARHANVYLRFILPALPAIMVEEVGIACLRGAGDFVSGLTVMLLVNVVNILASTYLLLGVGPFPELGWHGLAIGSLLGRLTGGAIVLAMLLGGRAGLRLRLRRLKPDVQLIRRILRIGVPGGIDSVIVVSLHMWYVAIINQLGTLAAAAHGVGVGIEALAYMPGAAFQMAAATMVGQFLGAGNPRRAGRSAAVACAVGGGFMTAAGVFFYFGSTLLAEFFLGGPASPVAPVASGLLRIVAFTMPALAVSMILAGALRGAGDTRLPLVINLVGFLGVRIPLAYWLAHDVIVLPVLGWSISGWGLGVRGAWYAMAIDVFLRCALVLVRFAHGGWKRVEV